MVIIAQAPCWSGIQPGDRVRRFHGAVRVAVTVTTLGVFLTGGRISWFPRAGVNRRDPALFDNAPFRQSLCRTIATAKFCGQPPIPIPRH
jgi:hypothetical protein